MDNEGYQGLKKVKSVTVVFLSVCHFFYYMLVLETLKNFDMWVRKTHLPIGGHITFLPMLIMMEKDDEKYRCWGLLAFLKT